VFDDLGEVAAVAVFPDGQRMATNSLDGMVRLWDLKNGVMLKEMGVKGCDWVVGGHVPMRDMALTRDGEILACSDESGYVTDILADLSLNPSESTQTLFPPWTFLQMAQHWSLPLVQCGTT